MVNYKNQLTGEVISEKCYNKLPYHKRIYFHVTLDSITHNVTQNESGDFILSFIAAEVTGSELIGFVVGGDIVGAFLGSELPNSIDINTDNDSCSNSSDSSFDFGGGDFGDGGAGGDI